MARLQLCDSGIGNLQLGAAVLGSGFLSPKLVRELIVHERQLGGFPLGLGKLPLKICSVLSTVNQVFLRKSKPSAEGHLLVDASSGQTFASATSFVTWMTCPCIVLYCLSRLVWAVSSSLYDV